MTRIAFLVVNLLFIEIPLESVRGALHIAAEVATTESEQVAYMTSIANWSLQRTFSMRCGPPRNGRLNGRLNGR